MASLSRPRPKAQPPKPRAQYIADKLERIQDLEDEVVELQSSLGEVSHKLALAKSETSSHIHDVNMKQKELDDFKHRAESDAQVKESST